MIWAPPCRTRVNMLEGERLLREVLEIERMSPGTGTPRNTKITG